MFCLIDVGLLFAPVDSAVSAALIVSASFAVVRFICWVLLSVGNSSSFHCFVTEFMTVWPSVSEFLQCLNRASVHVHVVACFVKCSFTPFMCSKKAFACTNWCCPLHCLSHNLLLCCVQPKKLINNDKDENLKNNRIEKSWKRKEHDRMQTQIHHQIQWNTNKRPQTNNHNQRRDNSHTMDG